MARLGFDPEAARAMYEAYKDVPGEQMNESVESFVARCKTFGLFFGLYDPEPVGAVVYDGPFIHAAVLPKARGKVAKAFIECLRYGLERIPMVISRVHPSHHIMKRLIVSLGFVRTGDADGYEIYVRQK